MELKADLQNINQVALTLALNSALPGVADGISMGGGAIRIHLSDKATEKDIELVQSIIEAHDPVFLSVDKTEIVADGQDVALVTVKAPKGQAAPVVLSTSTRNIPVEIEMKDGIGTLAVKTEYPQTFLVTLANPDNRTNDVLVIEAKAATPFDNMKSEDIMTQLDSNISDVFLRNVLKYLVNNQGTL